MASRAPAGAADAFQRDSLGAEPWVGTITGSAVDSRSGRPMDFTNISVLGTGLGATARNGRFRIDAVPIGHHRVQARFIGYFPQTLDVHVRQNQATEVMFRFSGGGCNAPAITVDAQGKVRINGVSVVRKPCPDSVVVTFQLLHDEVPVGHDLECLVRIENRSRHRVRVPKDLRRFVSAEYTYPNGNQDDFNPWWESMKEAPLGPTTSLGPGRSTEASLSFPGRGIPGRYSFQLTLWRPTKAWLWHEPAWIQHNCSALKSDRWAVTVLP